MEKSSKATTEEESGWTCYFDDFLAQQQIYKPNTTDTSISVHSFCSPSLVSDAASTVPWKKNYNHLPVDDQSTVPITPKKLSFKKTRTKKISYHDDSLEDTASSPVNSPKVSSLKQLDVKPGQREDNNEILKGPDDAFNIDTEFYELKNKGLSLVPLSMLANYIG